MSQSSRRSLLVLPLCLATVSPAVAQQPLTPQLPPGQAQPGQVQPGAAQPGQPQQPQPVQAPPGFPLNALQQAFVDQVLSSWQQNSDKLSTFKCDFERWDYNAAFGPGGGLPLNKDKGQLSYAKPDKGSFQITEVNVWQAQPVAPGQAPPAQAQGNWVKQPNAVGEHWVSDGEAIYEYRHDQKQLVVRTIPVNMRGKEIVNGPLPFLFGADAEKLKQRYWLRADQRPDSDEIWIIAYPRFQADAADYRRVDVILDRVRLMPKAMQIHLPDGSRHVYIFHLANATLNGHFDRLRSFFQSPRTPFGWVRVVEEMPLQQAAQPGAPPR